MNISVNKTTNIEKELVGFLSTRNILYNIIPIGIGFPYVESLSSYMIRLATFHNLSVSSLIESVISPYLTIEYIRKKNHEKSLTNYNSIFINSNNPGTFDYLNALEILVGRDDLQYLTLVNWHGVLGGRIITHNRRWCPACLDRMKCSNEIIYEPLIWLISAIDKCDIHEIPLRDRCPKCDRTLSFLHKKILNGYCQYCGTWLGEQKDVTKGILTSEEEYKLKTFKELIMHAPYCSSFPSKKLYSSFLSKCINELGFESKRKFAQFLEVRDDILINWSRGARYPNVSSLLKVLGKMNLTIYQMINGSEITIYPNSEKNKEHTNKYVSLNYIEQTLRAELLSENPRSLGEIIKQEDFGIKKAKKYFPELCISIKKHYFECKKKKHLNHQEDVKTKLIACLERDLPISLNQFAIENVYRVGTIKLYHPDLCSKVVERYKDYLHSRKQNRIENLLNEVEAAVNKLHNDGIYPSIHAINKLLNSSHLFLKKEVKDGWKHFMRNLGYEVD